MYVVKSIFFSRGYTVRRNPCLSGVTSHGSTLEATSLKDLTCRSVIRHGRPTFSVLVLGLLVGPKLETPQPRDLLCGLPLAAQGPRYSLIEEYVTPKTYAADESVTSHIGRKSYRSLEANI